MRFVAEFSHHVAAVCSRSVVVSDQTMDFPHSDEHRPKAKIPWSSAIRSTATSSYAPGPPAAFSHHCRTKPRSKPPPKLAVKLGELNRSSSGSQSHSEGEAERRDSATQQQQSNGHVSTEQ